MSMRGLVQQAFTEEPKSHDKLEGKENHRYEPDPRVQRVEGESVCRVVELENADRAGDTTSRGHCLQRAVDPLASRSAAGCALARKRSVGE